MIKIVKRATRGMDRKNSNNSEVKMKRIVFWFAGLSVVLIIWKLTVIESEVDSLLVLKNAIALYKDQLQLTQQQVLLLEHLENKKSGKSLPTIYCVTPTYWRFVQKAELTRISQTLQLVPNVHWLVVEDSEEKTELVTNLIRNSNVLTTHLNAKTPPFEQLHDKDPRWTKHRGVEQRNTGLHWIRNNINAEDNGVVFFMDDDNTYNVKLFDEISKVKKVGVWPVGLVGGLNAESPILDKVTGKVTGFLSGWKADRPFAIDMAGFAINVKLILEKSDAVFSYKMEKGLQESQFLSYFVSKDELEPLADNCTKVYVWHTRTENPKISGEVPGLEV